MLLIQVVFCPPWKKSPPIESPWSSPTSAVLWPLRHKNRIAKSQWPRRAASRLTTISLHKSQGFQGGPGAEPEPETGTVGTVFPGTERGTGTRNRRNRLNFPGTERGTGTAGTVFQELKPEPEPFFPVKQYWNTQKPPSFEEPLEPKTGTARTVPSPNRNRTEPGPPWVLRRKLKFC